MKFANILVGCGGSGLKTLSRVADLMSEDPVWRTKMRSEVYFFAVDTDGEDLNRFSANVRSAFSDPDHAPHVESFQLSAGVSDLRPLVYQNLIEPFDGQGNDEAKERLLQHWWTNRSGHPFDARAIRQTLVNGAGQCPPVSYFLTWYNMERLEEAIARTIESIEKRTQGLESLNGINLIITTSLAGGTGRGSWNLIAFKFRDALIKRSVDKIPRPAAFLYDASVFPNVVEKYPAQEVPLKINSLTGLSELSCWIQNRKQEREVRDVFDYRLPSLRSPGSEESDVIIAKLRPDINYGAPVDHVYLCFGQNSNHQLGRSTRYFEMFGSTIYGTLAAHEHHKETINSNFDYNSAGTITYEVNAASIRKYFECRVKEKFAEQLLNDDNQAAKQLANRIWQDCKVDAAHTYRTIENALANERSIRARIANIRPTAEATQDLKEVENTIQSAIKPSDAAVIAKNVVEEILPDKKQGVENAVIEHVSAFFAENPHFGTVATTLRYLQGAIRQASKAVADEFRETANPLELAQALSSRRLFGLMKPFEDHELSEIEESVTGYLCHAYKPYLLEELRGFFESLEYVVHRFRKNTDALLEVAAELEYAYEDDVRAVSRREDAPASSEQVFDELFADPTAPETALDHEFSPVKFFKREIKPIYDREAEIHDLARTMNDVSIESLFQQWFCYSGDLEQRQVEREIEPALQKEINSLRIGTKFVQERFSLNNCLPQIFSAWERRLEAEPSDDNRSALVSKFTSFFGFPPVLERDRVRIKPVGEAIVHMAIHLAKTCRPFWVTNIAGEKTSANVFFNAPQKKDEAERLFDNLRGANTGWTAVIGAHENPFIMFAVATQGLESLDDVQSANYHTKAGVIEDIRKCESQDALMIFDTSKGRNGGLGFVSPIYVRNEQLRAMRWRPWGDREVEAKMERDHQALDALFYALLGNQFPEDSSVDTDLADLNWTMPLISEQKGNRFVCQRNFRKEELDGSGNFKEDLINPKGWEQSKPLTPHAGVRNALDSLVQNEEVRERIRAEREVFWRVVAPKLNLVVGGTLLMELLDQFHRWLAERHLKDGNEDNKQVWKALLEYAVLEFGMS